MKIIVTILCLIIPAVASAQNQGPDMQKLGQAMQEMMQCMAQINHAELASLQEKSELRARVLSLPIKQARSANS